MIGAPLHVAGERLMLDPSGCVFWPDRGLLAVADLHLEKGTSFARAGMLLPPYDTRQTLDRLTRVVRRFTPRTLVCLGDSFHDAGGALRLASSDRAQIARLGEGRDMIWIAGNHDPAPAPDMPGRALEEYRAGPFVLRHLPREIVTDGFEIAGHLHPKASIQVRGQTLSRPCFAAGANRLILPAFGAFTGGLDVRDRAISSLFAEGCALYLLGRERLYHMRLPASRPTARRRIAR